jgi:hypothetical protein
VEWPDLAAVGVPGDLQVDAVCDGAVDLLRLVGEQQHRQQRVGAGQGCGVAELIVGNRAPIRCGITRRRVAKGICATAERS